MTFYAAVSSEAGFDWLRWHLDGVVVQGISGYAFNEFRWFPFTFAVPPGYHVITWSYSKDGSQVEGADRAWLDGVMVLNYDGIPKLSSLELPDGYVLWTDREQYPVKFESATAENEVPRTITLSKCDIQQADD